MPQKLDWTGFGHHDHKRWVMKALISCGYHLVWSRIIDLVDQSPSYRPRWLGVAVNINSRHSLFWKYCHSGEMQPMAFDANMLVEGTMIFQAPIHLTCFKSSTNAPRSRHLHHGNLVTVLWASRSENSLHWLEASLPCRVLPGRADRRPKMW